MNCRNCGSPLGPNEVFCRVCGTSVDMQSQPVPTVQPQPQVEPQLIPAVQPQPTIEPQPMPAVQPQPQVEPQPMPVAQPHSGGIPPITPVALGTSTSPVGTIPNVNMMNSGAGQSSMEPPKSSKKGSKILIAIIIVVIILIVGIVLYFTVFKDSGKPNGPGDSSSNSSDSNTSSNTSSNSGSNSGTNPGTLTNSFTMNHGGFTFQIPTQYEVSVQNEYLVVTDGSSWKMKILPILGTYEFIVEEEMKSLVEKDGATDVEIDKKNVNGREYVVVTFTYAERKDVVVYTKANSYYVFGVEIMTAANTYGTDLLNVVDQVLSEAVYSGTGNNFGIEDSKVNLKKYITK